MTDRPTNRSKGGHIHARIMSLVHDTSSECALQMYVVSLKYLKRLSSYRAGTKKHCTRSKGNNSKNIHSRVMVLLHDKLSHCALELYEVSTK